MLKSLGLIVYKWKRLVLCIFILFVVFSGVYGFKVFGTLPTEGYDNPTSDSTLAQNFITTHLPDSTTDIIVILRSKTLTVQDPVFTNAVEKLVTSLQQRKEIRLINSYYQSGNTQFVSFDKHATYITILLANPQKGSTKDTEYTKISSLLTAKPLQSSVGGNLVINEQINNQISQDIEHAEIYTLPIVLALLLIIFGSVSAASLPLVIGSISIVGGISIIRLISTYTNVSVFALNIITALGLGLAIDYSLFIITRFREELGNDDTNIEKAIQNTLATAGRTVIFSGLTVCTSMLSLLLFPEYFLRSIGLGAIAAIIVAMFSAIILLPAILSLLGRNINALAIRKHIKQINKNEQQGVWYRISQTVMKFPIPIAIGVIAILIFLGYPFLHIQFSEYSISSFPASFTSIQVYTELTKDFPYQPGAVINIAVQSRGDIESKTNIASLQAYVDKLQEIPGVVGINSLVSVNPALTLADYQMAYTHIGTNKLLDSYTALIANDNATRIDLTLTAADNSDVAITTVNRIRAIRTDFTTYIGGQTAQQMDLFDNLKSVMPLALGLIATFVFILLFAMTGSIVIPIKAIFLNILSLTASFGALVFVFQDGHFLHLLGVAHPSGLQSTQLLLIFTIAFGLSMDYEVFLLSRIKERYDQTKDNTIAIASGLQRTGGLITSAALLLAVVLAGFILSEISTMKMLGLGLVIAVLIDATLVRILLVPATMKLLGRINWWAPKFLRSFRNHMGENTTHA